MSLPALLYHCVQYSSTQSPLSASFCQSRPSPSFSFFIRGFSSFHLSVYLASLPLRLPFPEVYCVLLGYECRGCCHHFAYSNDRVDEFGFTALLSSSSSHFSRPRLVEKFGHQKINNKNKSFSLLYCSVAAIIQCI
jgi:hypothetical protein